MPWTAGASACWSARSVFAAVKRPPGKLTRCRRFGKDAALIHMAFLMSALPATGSRLDSTPNSYFGLLDLHRHEALMVELDRAVTALDYDRARCNLSRFNPDLTREAASRSGSFVSGRGSPVTATLEHHRFELERRSSSSQKRQLNASSKASVRAT